MNPKTVLKYASDQGAKFVSVRFTDLPGSWQHLTFPIGELGEETFEEGFGFDASSIRGWAAIHESDMLLVPDASILDRSFLRTADTVLDRKRSRPHHQRGLRI